MSNPFEVPFIEAGRTMLPPAQTDCGALYYTNSIVDVGESHRVRRFNGQDHARSVACSQGVVLCVADGVSQVQDERGQVHMSAAEVGAWLAAELATVAALEALKSGASPNGIKDAVASALVGGLGPVAALLGSRAYRGLSTTLVLMVITPAWTYAWASGDGYWGAMVSADADDVGDARPFRLLAGSRHQPELHHLATTRVQRGTEAVAAELEPVLAHRGPVIAGFVGTDGLRDEARLLDAVRRPGCTNRTELQTMLRRLPDCDDIGLAWASERFPDLVKRHFGGAS